MSFESHQSEIYSHTETPEQPQAREFTMPENCLRHMLDIITSDDKRQDEKDRIILELETREQTLVASIPPGFALSCLAESCQARYLVRRLSSSKPFVHALSPEIEAACQPESKKPPQLHRQNRGY